MGVYAQNDQLIGSGIFNDGKAAVTIWGDDGQTEIKEGAESNELLHFKHYDVRTGRVSEIELDNLVDGIKGTELSSVTYNPNKFIVAKAQIEIMNDDLGFMVRPNPFSDDLAIEFNLQSESSNVRVEVYNLSGSSISTLFDDLLERWCE